MPDRINTEKLQRLETLVDERVIPMLERIEQKVDEDVADLAKWKATGRGVLIGVGLLFTALGTLLSDAFKSAMAALFH